MHMKVFDYESHDPIAPIPGGHDPWATPGHGHLTDVSGASVIGTIAGGSGSSGQGSGATPSSSFMASNETVVGGAGGLQIDLLWDSSVGHAPSAFKPAVIAAATSLANLFSTNEVITIHVGWGEVAGSPLPSNALGASDSSGYLTDYATVEGALHAPAAGNDPTASQFFVTGAEAKALGLVSPTSAAVDGYIGFSTLRHTGYSWDYNTSASPIGATQFDFQAVAQHEISEVMGRIGMEGAIVSNQPTYTPLDLFNYNSPNMLELSGNGGYFSNDGGTTNLGTYNDATVNGGDIADWASPASPSPGSYDAFNAFAAPGEIGQVTGSDIGVMAALGYTVRTV